MNELPEGYVPFKYYTVKPETKDKDGNIIPADVRELPNLYVKIDMEWDDEGMAHFTPHFITFDSQHQYRRLTPDKFNPRCVKTREINRKVCSISFSKISYPTEGFERSETEAPKVSESKTSERREDRREDMIISY
jgi:hypothetical protein